MLKLKNVSKYYYSKGMIASGFTKISLDLNMGEFVAITGESGSGKSTLLNVISGLDSYEDGEMYINGEETSHYNEKDFEEYRKKYIGNIFQHFNLVNSYTVYQNIELVLLLNGYKKKEIKEKIIEIIRQVDLARYKNTKVSKLSGGQKQRVAIARALAKDTPIIVADEPTGNLDSRAASSVLKLLHDISKDKLVIVVTHNYDQIEKYATRKIKMHDGKIIEDQVIKKIDKDELATDNEYKNISKLNTLRLGVRNAFNIIPKFLLLFLVYFFLTSVVTSFYSTIAKQDYEESKIGFNSYFSNTNPTRIIIKKADKSVISEEDYTQLSNLDNVSDIVRSDMILDTYVSLYGNEFNFFGTIDYLKKIDFDLDYGHMPAKDNEIIICGDRNDYYLSERSEMLIGKQLELQNNYSVNANAIKVVVTGIKYIDVDYSFMNSTSTIIYASDKIINEVDMGLMQGLSKTLISINGKDYESSPYMVMYKVEKNSKVKKGYTYISSDFNMLCSNYSCANKKIKINVSNINYKDELTLKVKKIYNKDNFTKLTGIKDYDANNGTIYINPSDYDYLYNKGYYQSSIFVHDVTRVNDTINELTGMGYKTLYVKDTLVNYFEGELQFTRILRVGFIAIAVIALFFISYFVIKIIFKSRNIYFSTIRILGATEKVSKKLLDIEMLVVINIAYFIFLLLAVLIKTDVISIAYIRDLTKYLVLTDYLIIYVILIIMSYLISTRYANKLFKKTAMSAYREEV